MANAIKWVHEFDLNPKKKEIKKITRQLHFALQDLSMTMEHLGYSQEQIDKRLRSEFFSAVNAVIKEES